MSSYDQSEILPSDMEEISILVKLKKLDQRSDGRIVSDDYSFERIHEGNRSFRGLPRLSTYNPIHAHSYVVYSGDDRRALTANDYSSEANLRKVLKERMIKSSYQNHMRDQEYVVLSAFLLENIHWNTAEEREAKRKEELAAAAAATKRPSSTRRRRTKVEPVEEPPVRKRGVGKPEIEGFKMMDNQYYKIIGKFILYTGGMYDERTMNQIIATIEAEEIDPNAFINRWNKTFVKSLLERENLLHDKIIKHKRDMVSLNKEFGEIRLLRQSSQTTGLDKIKESLESIKEIPGVAKISFTGRGLRITTGVLWATDVKGEDKNKHYMGVYEILIDVFRNGVLIRNIAAAGTRNHPNGTCLGSYADVFLNALAMFDYNVLVGSVIEYLQTYNSYDGHTGEDFPLKEPKEKKQLIFQRVLERTSDEDLLDRRSEQDEDEEEDDDDNEY